MVCDNLCKMLTFVDLILMKLAMNYSRLLKFAFLLFVLMIISCAPSVEDDAKEAATLTQKSLEYTSEKNLVKAEEYFTKSKIIRDKYKDSGDEFYELYMKHLDLNLENE